MVNMIEQKEFKELNQNSRIEYLLRFDRIENFNIKIEPKKKK